MKLFQSLKRTVEILAPWPDCWAICGGVAAAIYRPTPRYTGDIDIVLVDAPSLPAAKLAEQVVTALGYKPIAGWIADRQGKLIGSQALVVGREAPGGSYIGIDFLLPVLPWITEAVRRAQFNRLDFGFANLPTITPEDLLIAKLFAFADSPERMADLDDLISICSSSIALDEEYLRERIARYGLSIPSQLERIAKLQG
jgi:hypothetical protein